MVSKVKVKNNLKEAIEKAIEPLGGIAEFVKAGEKVFIKPNFNTSDPFPASSDLDFLRQVISIVSTQNPKEIILADSPTYFGPSKKYFTEINAKSLEKEFSNLKVLFLNEEPWIEKEVPAGRYLKKASVPKILDEVDKIIFLPCLKTHGWAKFTGALKLSVGLMKPIERLELHAANLQEKIAELNLLFKPDLIIMDARKCFINQGPEHGEVKEPNLILASKNRSEIDIEGIKIIQGYDGNDLKGIKPEQLPQIKHSREIGV